MKEPYRGLSRLIAALVLQSVFVTIAYGESIVPFRLRFPKAKQIETAIQGEDCAIYRKMKHKADVQIEVAERTQAKYAENLVQTRLALESCARQHGIEDIDDENDDILVAELCAPFYQEWLKPAARLEMLGADLRDAVDMRDVMQNRLKNYCGHISNDSSDDLSNG